MPLFRPFASPNLTIGTDICHVSRIHKIIYGPHQNGPSKLPGFLRRVFTPREQLAFRRKFPQAVNPEHAIECPTKLGETALASNVDLVADAEGRMSGQVARYLAGRWAAKEAIVKACTWRRLTFDQIQILKSSTGPSVYGVILDKSSSACSQDAMDSTSTDSRLQDETEQDETEQESGQIVKVSISHDGEYATAVCLAAEEPREGDVGGEAAARGM